MRHPSSSFLSTLASAAALAAFAPEPAATPEIEIEEWTVSWPGQRPAALP